MFTFLKRSMLRKAILRLMRVQRYEMDREAFDSLNKLSKKEVIRTCISMFKRVKQLEATFSKSK